MPKPDPSEVMPQRYLGDGLYAEFDGFQLRLYTQSGNNVWLEPSVWEALKRFMQEQDQ